MVPRNFMFDNALQSLYDCMADVEMAKNEGRNFHSFYQTLEGEEKEAFLDLVVACKEFTALVNQIK